jgi:hypothetical protein
MKKRVKTLNRVQQLQKQLYDLSVWRLNSLEGQLASLEGTRSELLDAKGSDPMYYGPLGALAARRLRSVERQISSVKEHQSAQAQHALDQGGRLRLAERLLDKANADHRSHSDRLQLAEIIDRVVRDKSTS